VEATPAEELARARHFLSGWTLARYTARFHADAPAAGHGSAGAGNGRATAAAATTPTGRGTWQISQILMTDMTDMADIG
jgi:hypothetical protein